MFLCWIYILLRIKFNRKFYSQGAVRWLCSDLRHWGLSVFFIFPSQNTRFLHLNLFSEGGSLCRFIGFAIRLLVALALFSRLAWELSIRLLLSRPDTFRGMAFRLNHFLYARYSWFKLFFFLRGLCMRFAGVVVVKFVDVLTRFGKISFDWV